MNMEAYNEVDTAFWSTPPCKYSEMKKLQNHKQEKIDFFDVEILRFKSVNGICLLLVHPNLYCDIPIKPKG